MSVKNKAKVMVDGQIITIGGYESEDYLQNVANYVNRKIAEFEKIPNYSRLSQDRKKALLALNIADDYFKAREQIRILEEDIANRNREAYEMKEKIVTAGVELENLKKQNDRNNNDRNKNHRR